MGIKDYIDSNYTIVWQHPQSVAADWNTFLLEEHHNHQLARKVNGAFVSQFATLGSFFVTESTKRLEQNKRPYTERNIFQIQTPHIPNERFIGWDLDDIVYKEPLIQAYNWIYRLLKENSGKSDLFDIDWRKTLIHNFDLLLNETDWLDPKDKLHLDLSSFIEDAINIVSNEMESFQNQTDEFLDKATKKLTEANEIAEKIIELENKIDFDVDQPSFDFYSVSLSDLDMALELKKHKIDLINCKKELSNIKEEMNVLVYEKQKDLLDKIYLSFKNFPERTESMVITLDRVDQFIMHSEAKAFFIAGSAHLEEDLLDESEPDWPKDTYSLKSLYQYLEDHKNVVILRPKVLSSTNNLLGPRQF